MTTIIILSAVIASVTGISILIIKRLRKKNKSLTFKLEFAEAQIIQMEKNKKAYEKRLIELGEIKSKYDTLRKDILNTTGNNLSINLNKL